MIDEETPQTNCRNCTYASRDGQGWQCRVITDRWPREDAVRRWCIVYCDNRASSAGAPLEHATGCPGWGPIVAGEPMQNRSGE